MASGVIADDLCHQSFGLSQTGNWLTEDLDLNGDGDLTDADERDATNTFNNANEWLTRDKDGVGGVDYTLVYDAAGNLTDDDLNYKYEYDAFGRLRKVKKTGGTNDLVAEYRYNGLNQRITTHFDTDIDGDVDGSDVVSHFVYDARWRMAARYEDTDANPMEQWVFHHAGLAESGSSSYIDSVILRDRDTTPTPDGVLNERMYYLQNWRADVVALIKDNGDQIEQIRYEPYGTPFGLPKGDTDSDGDFDSNDVLTGSYDVRKDVNMDGTINFYDITAAISGTGYQTLARNTASSPAIDNRKTYASYEHLAELAGAKYDVRNRVLIAELGTWSRRDPMGYVDGMSLYAYVALMPIMMVDQMAFLASATTSSASVGGFSAAGGSTCGIGGSSIAGVGGCGGQSSGDGGTASSDCYKWDQWCRDSCYGGDGRIYECLNQCATKLQKCLSLVTKPTRIDNCIQQARSNPEYGTASCLKYTVCDAHKCANARCFCMCAGFSPWSAMVRACLRCAYDSGLSPDYSHKQCYAAADKLYPRPWRTLAGCAIACWRVQAQLCPLAFAKCTGLSRVPQSIPFPGPILPRS